MHHTQLLNRLVREGKLTPVAEGAGAAKRSITYHDPCYIGRHNQVYEPPRELLQVMPGAEFTEMPRNSERSFCCGAGGARMWMEENLGSRINVNRTKEAVATGADQIAVGCPFCRVMLSDGLTAEQADGNAREEVEVLDVAQMLLASVKGESATKARKAASNGAPAAAPAEAKSDEATKDEPEPGDATQTEETVTETAEVGAAAKASGGSSLFDVEEDTAPEPTAAEPEAEAEKPEQSGGSLFDIGGDAEEPEPADERPREGRRAGRDAREDKAEAKSEISGGGSLFDIEADEEPAPAEATSLRRPRPSRPRKRRRTRDHGGDVVRRPEPTEIPEGGSLFDIEAPERARPGAEQTPAAESEQEDEEPAQAEQARGRAGRGGGPRPRPRRPTAPSTEIPEGGSLFDIEAPEEPAPAAAATEPEREQPEPAAPRPSQEQPETEAGDQVSSGAALSQAATVAASDDEPR